MNKKFNFGSIQLQETQDAATVPPCTFNACSPTSLALSPMSRDRHPMPLSWALSMGWMKKELRAPMVASWWHIVLDLLFKY